MNAYIYQAALVCEPCGNRIKQELTKEGFAPANPADENSFDSDIFPKGPFPDGGGESDSPSHCDACQVFLGNALTSDGETYVKQLALEKLPAEWADAYGYIFE